MHYCCANCFNHHLVTTHITENGALGNCSFCRSESVLVMNVEDDYFAQVMFPFAHFFRPNDKGFELERFFTKQIDLLSKGLDASDAKALLYHLFRGTHSKEKLKGLFTTQLSVESSGLLERWENFKRNIKHGNRFGFGIDELLKETIIQILQVNEKQIPEDATFFRARLGKPTGAKITPFEGKDIMCAPENRVSEGRINPRGIPYLYLTNDIDTAIAEVRPYKSAEVSVGTIKTVRSVKISSFNNATYHGQGLPQQLELYCLTNKINIDLSKPISEETKYLSYIPTQYVAELAKHLDFEGIEYQSALEKGTNYCLFNERKVTFVSSKLYRVNNVSYDSDLVF